MCGIAGAVSYAGSFNNDLKKMVSMMVESMHHRGPDDSGIYEVAPCFLGHNRLSILDVSANGHQPFVSADSNVAVVVNGEIYNYKEIKEILECDGYVFSSESDSEVVLHGYLKWGEALPKYLKGMFSFAIYDRLKKCLYLVRDRQGIKPLYYTQADGVFVFASEVSALLSTSFLDKKINKLGLQYYLLLGYVPGFNNLIENVCAVLPGQMLSVKPGEVKKSFYWNPPVQEKNTLNKDDLISSTRFLLEKSVKRHLQSDVPLGIFLSGGIDSTVVAGLATHLTDADISTFSLGFKDGPKRINELETARAIAKYYNTKHTELIVDGKHVLDRLEGIVSSVDLPTFDGINTYLISELVKKEGITVALSGLGGDELFGGYGIYKHHRNLYYAGRLARLMPSNIKKLAAKLVSYAGNNKVRSEKVLRMENVTNYFDMYLMIRANGWYDEYISTALRPKLESQLSDSRFTSDSWRQLQNFEMKNYMSWRLLRDTDAMSMAHSLEVRVPLIDDDIVEHVLSLPKGWEVELGWPKQLLTKSLDDILPEFILNLPKQGFQLPMDCWLKNELKSVVDSVFLSNDNNRLMPSKYMQEIYRKFTQGLIPYEYIWKHVVLDMWVKKHNLTF